MSVTWTQAWLPHRISYNCVNIASEARQTLTRTNEILNHVISLRPVLALLILASSALFAQNGAAPGQDTVEPGSGAPSAPDSEDSYWNRFWISFQANFIRQQHPTFPALYSGPNSFLPAAEHATSRIETLYTGFRIMPRLEILADIESAGGAGLSNALGIAGFTNVDVVRNPTLGEAPYVSRVMLHYTLPLSKETTEATRNPLSLASSVPVRRLEFRLGKMSTVDFFDLNSVGSDSHLQFMNWAIVNNGAYDYAADTRGYTYGLVAEYYAPSWAARFGEMLMPTVANGITLDWNIARARGENFEVEHHMEWLPKRTTIVRALSFVNHANMGNYREAINGYLSGKDPVPDVTLYRKQGRMKYGFGLNAEQELTPSMACVRAPGLERRQKRIVRVYRNRPHGADRQRFSRRALGPPRGQDRRGLRGQRHLGRPPALSCAGRIGFHPGRRRSELRPGKNLRNLLHGPNLAGRLCRPRLSARD